MTTTSTLKWVRHRWSACAVRTFTHRPFAQRCPMCCRCTDWRCGCPAHAIAQAVNA